MSIENPHNHHGWWPPMFKATVAAIFAGLLAFAIIGAIFQPQWPISENPFTVANATVILGIIGITGIITMLVLWIIEQPWPANYLLMALLVACTTGLTWFAWPFLTAFL